MPQRIEGLILSACGHIAVNHHIIEKLLHMLRGHLTDRQTLMAGQKAQNPVFITLLRADGVLAATQLNQKAVEFTTIQCSHTLKLTTFRFYVYWLSIPSRNSFPCKCRVVSREGLSPQEKVIPRHTGKSLAA